MTTPRLSIRGLHVSFGSNHVLRGVDLDIHENESLVVIGTSGTGKSVLVKSVIGIVEPSAGSVRYDGVEILGSGDAVRDSFNRGIGMLFQGAALFDSLPLWENVAFGLLTHHRTPRSEARETACRLLGEVGLGPEVSNRYPGEVSAGARKRAGLARAIATRPRLLFFDEPTTGIDPVMGETIDRLIRKCVRELGATSLTITHDMESARRIGDRIAMLHNGRVIWAGRVEEIETSGNPVVDQFIHGLSDGPIVVEAGVSGP